MKEYSHLLYLALNVGTILVPFIFSFHPKFSFYKTWGAFWPANLITALVFILWDIAFTEMGIWGFNPTYLTGLNVINLPLEECLFFICIPYACVFTYYCIGLWIPTKQVKRDRLILRFVSALLLVIGLLYFQKWYTSVTFISTSIFLFFLSLRGRLPWLLQFLVAYLLLLIPFFLVNGVLTGSWIPNEVVWYNNAENLGIRIGTVPIDDSIYMLLMLLMNVALYEFFKRKGILFGSRVG